MNVGQEGIYVVIEFLTNWVKYFTPLFIVYITQRCKVMGCCSSAVEAKEKAKEKVQRILKDVDIARDTVVMTGGDGVMIKSWLVDLFTGKIYSDNCYIITVVGTSVVNCGISSN